MRRDWEVIRKILLAVEALPSTDNDLDCDQIEGVPPDVAAYHMRLLRNEGLTEGGGRDSVPGGPPWQFANALTWQGHELLDSIRGDTAWKRIKSTAAEKGIDLTVDAVKALARFVLDAMLKGTLPS